jgi:DNA invertase Pin-like site-specific DNA recombinase
MKRKPVRTASPSGDKPLMTRCAIYARVSTKDKGQDTENQLLQLREFCARSNWTITHEFLDHVSGKSSENRPRFQALLDGARRRDFDLVLFWSLDRFSREGVLPTLKYLELLTSYGCGWKSFTEQYFDSCGIFRDAIISIAATLAKQERIRISERTMAGLARAKKKGRCGGRPVKVFRRDRAIELRDQGMSWRKIGQALGVPQSTIRLALKSVQKT